jgi:hypothetical protein
LLRFCYVLARRSCELDGKKLIDWGDDGLLDQAGVRNGAIRLGVEKTSTKHKRGFVMFFFIYWPGARLS